MENYSDESNLSDMHQKRKEKATINLYIEY